MKYFWVALVVGACVLGVYSGLHPYGFLFALGMHPVPAGTPWTYQMWSGIIPALAVLSLFGGAINLVRRHNCNVHGCFRIGRYPVANGAYRVCRPHHPEDHVREKRTAFSHIKAAHEAAKVSDAAQQA